MLLNYQKGFINYDGYKKVKYRGLNIYYRGILWMHGKRAGMDSIMHFAQKYIEKGMIPYNELFGAFSCIVEHPGEKVILFTDNSNMHCFFIGEEALGTNFLETAKANKVASFNFNALCEFISLGDVYFGKTLLSEINLTENDKVYIYERGKIRINEKGIGGIDRQSTISDVNEFFRDMAYALSEHKISLSLTGGYDSRMVFACLNNYIQVDTFISGDNDTDDEFVVSKKVALAAGREQEIVRIPKPNTSGEYIKHLFEYAQGVVPFLNNGYMRVSSFIQDRADKGYDCYLSGDGGVMHKDWWWMQDLPFYRRKHTNIDKFYKQRISFGAEKVPYGSALIGTSSTLQEKMINRIAGLVKPMNTQSYDSFYNVINGRKIVLQYNTHSKVLPSYAPLWELELVRYSYHLPRRKRFFNNSIREVTTKANRVIARIPTVYGTTSSDETLYIARDVFFQFFDYFKKACRMLGRKYFNKNFFVKNPVTWNVENEVRDLSLSHEALKYSIDNRFIKQGTKLDEIPFTLLGRLIQVYLLGEYLNNQSDEKIYK